MEGLLDETICLCVNRCCGFIQYEDLEEKEVVKTCLSVSSDGQRQVAVLFHKENTDHFQA